MMPDSVEQDSEEKGKADNKEDADNALLRLWERLSVLVLADVSQTELTPIM